MAAPPMVRTLRSSCVFTLTTSKRRRACILKEVPRRERASERPRASDRRVNAKITFHSLLNLKSNASSSKQQHLDCLLVCTRIIRSAQHFNEKSAQHKLRVFMFDAVHGSPRQPAAILAPFQHSMTNRELDVQARAPDPQALKIHFHP